MLNRYVIYFFVFMLMEIIVFTIATMTQDIVFCGDAETVVNRTEMFESRKSLWGNCDCYWLSNDSWFTFDYKGVKYFYQLSFLILGSFTAANVIDNNSVNQGTVIIQTPWYLREECLSKTTGQILLAFANWMILFSYVIPISLFVSLEILRFLSSMSFRSDLQM